MAHTTFNPLSVASSPRTVHDLPKRPKRTERIRAFTLNTTRLVPLFQHLRRVREGPVREALGRLSGRAQRVNPVDEAVDGEFQVLGKGAEALFELAG